MKINPLMLIAGMAISTSAIAQNQPNYHSLVQEANNLYKTQEFEKAALKFKEGFDYMNGKAYPNDRYNAACSYALAENTDSAFYHLNRLATSSKYKNINHLTRDTDLVALQKDPRWEDLTALVLSNKLESEKNLDPKLVAILDTIEHSDQYYRMQVDETETKFGRQSDEYKAIWKKVSESDEINTKKVTQILDTRGWLGADIVGEAGNRTLFLVIQHADIDTQVKYLPMMKKAVKKGHANPSSLALLEDRVALRQGKKQIYGSQIGRDKETGEHYVLPLINPEQVDERRAEVNLGKLAGYVGRWNLIWDVDKHKERMAKMEAEKNN